MYVGRFLVPVFCVYEFNRIITDRNSLLPEFVSLTSLLFWDLPSSIEFAPTTLID